MDLEVVARVVVMCSNQDLGSGDNGKIDGD